MGKIKSPLRFSNHYKINPKRLASLGVFDAVLGSDTHLFIDPIAVDHTTAPELKRHGSERIKKFFIDLYKLLSTSNRVNDIWWNAAKKLLSAHEIKGTCLGYGSGNISGSGWGDALVNDLLNHAKELISKGVDDPDLFLLVGLFQENIGPDRISDLVTNVIAEDLVAYTQRICSELGIPVQEFEVCRGIIASLPVNPTQIEITPILLVPCDILRELPVALSYDEIWDAAQHNTEIRQKFNSQLGGVWGRISREQKSDLLKGLLKDSDYAKRLIKELRGAKATPYNLASDDHGLVVWADLAYVLGASEPLRITNPRYKTVESLNRVVVTIIEQFTFLIEQRDLWKVLHESPSRKIEKVAQTMFFATAFSYCKANNLDITPEADTGNGPVDFKFSSGDHPKILVELKLSKNNVIKGYANQLPVYVSAESADRAHYVVLDVGMLGDKWAALQKLHSEKKAAGEKVHSIWIVNATERPSASKR